MAVLFPSLTRSKMMMFRFTNQAKKKPTRYVPDPHAPRHPAVDKFARALARQLVPTAELSEPPTPRRPQTPPAKPETTPDDYRV
jgi:hypothetical protein